MGHVIYKLYGEGVITPPAALIWISIAALLDLMALLLALRRNARGRGASGIPVIPWCIYCYATIFSLRPVPFSGHPWILFRFVNLGVLTGFHVLCQFTLPKAHLRWVKRRRQE